MTGSWTQLVTNLSILYTLLLDHYLPVMYICIINSDKQEINP